MVIVPNRETELGADRLLRAKVVYERPNPSGYSGLYAEPGPKLVPGSWSKTFGWSPRGDGQVVQKSPPTPSASEGQVTGKCPLGLTLPKITSATPSPPWVPGR
jgi:hypothetical protein